MPDETRDEAPDDARNDVRGPRPTQTAEGAVRFLFNSWFNSPPALPERGNRVFARWLELRPPSWNDWTLIGLVHPDLSIEWMGGAVGGLGPTVLIEDLIKSGDRHGWIAAEGARMEWGLFLGDGPTEARTADLVEAARRVPRKDGGS